MSPRLIKQSALYTEDGWNLGSNQARNQCLLIRRHCFWGVARARRHAQPRRVTLAATDEVHAVSYTWSFQHDDSAPQHGWSQRSHLNSWSVFPARSWNGPSLRHYVEEFPWRHHARHVHNGFLWSKREILWIQHERGKIVKVWKKR